MHAPTPVIMVWLFSFRAWGLASDLNTLRSALDSSTLNSVHWDRTNGMWPLCSCRVANSAQHRTWKTSGIELPSQEKSPTSITSQRCQLYAFWHRSTLFSCSETAKLTQLVTQLLSVFAKGPQKLIICIQLAALHTLQTIEWVSSQ